VPDTTYPQISGNINKHLHVLNIYYMFSWNLSNIQCYTKYIRVGLSKMDEAGGYEKVHEPV